MRSKRIAFVTSRDFPNLTDDDRVASRALSFDGIEVVPTIWNDSSVDWFEFDAIIVRSCWDYYKHHEAFRIWVASVKNLPVWNPPAVLRWNMEKRYLFDLERKGVSIPRTILLRESDPFDPVQLCLQVGTNDVIIKPSISASAWKTWKSSLTHISETAMKRVDEMQSHSEVMIQEYMPEIADGEWSLVFFGNVFSHAVRKYPGPNDFRVQKELGGRYHAVPRPPESIVRQAEEVVGAVGTMLLYARVDGVVRGEKLILMELELIEPQLFFDVQPDGAKMFGQQVHRLALA